MSKENIALENLKLKGMFIYSMFYYIYINHAVTLFLHDSNFQTKWITSDV